MISARSEDTDKIDALDAGADDYLTKPFSVEELLARLRVTQRRLAVMNGRAGRESVFTNGRLRIDYGAGCAYLGEKEMHLTPIEYKLLCLMAQNVGKVLDPSLYHAEGMGSSWDNDIASCGYLWQLCVKAGERGPIPPVYQTPYRSGVSDDEGGIKLRTGLQDTPEAVQNAETKEFFLTFS